MVARRAIVMAILLGLMGSTGALPARPVHAGPDVCPEPNDQFAAACFLGPGEPVLGYLDAASDVDLYRIEVPESALVTARIDRLPGDYTLRILLPDGSVQAETAETGTVQKVARADGLLAGSYYLAVVSLRGEANPSQPYAVSVAYSESIVLATPSVPDGPLATPQGAVGFVPQPARLYALTPSDVGEGFRELGHREGQYGEHYASVLVAPDARIDTRSPKLSTRTYSVAISEVLVMPHGADHALRQFVDQVLARWRTELGANVEPAVGWGSEQVYSYAWADPQSGFIRRGILLRHRNAVAAVEIWGVGRLTTWDDLARLARTVEARLHGAVL